jgi:hypothetical protein
MSVANLAVPFPRFSIPRSEGVWRFVVLAFVFALSATLWAFTRIPMAGSMHAWSSQQCVRLEMSPRDLPCQVTLGRTLSVYLAASALVSLAALVPAVVLALRGRRLLAFVPMLAPLAITFLAHVSSWAWSSYWAPFEQTSTPQLFLGPWAPWTAGGLPRSASVWRPDHLLAIGADLVLLAVPVLVMIALFRPTKAPRAGLSGRAVLLACVIAAGASAIIEWGAHTVIGAGLYLEGGWFIQGLVMVSFGLLLPVGRRRPLWAIAPVACLVSLGGATAIVGTLYDYTAFTYFRAAVPLALMGFAGAAASAFVTRQRGFRMEPGPERPRRIRPISIAYGLGFGALAVTTVMFALDPLPFQVATPLPTYLGARDRVVDLRSRLTLEEALGVAARYRAAHGSFEGFDAASARESGSHLLWDDGLPPAASTFGPELTVRVVDASEERLELVLVQTPTTYCVTTTSGGDPTYGVARTGHPRPRALLAVETCGAQPWTSELLKPFPIDGFCNDAPDIVLCRMAQKNLRDLMASSTGIA